MNTDTSQIDPSFGYWLSGLVDGDGTFCLASKESQGYPNWYTSFTISLRADDAAILRYIQTTLAQLGITSGVYIRYPRPRKNHMSDKPQADLRVGRKKSCALICDLFTRFPFRTRKSERFALWKTAVLELGKTGATCPHHPSQRNNGVLYEIKRAIHQLRVHNGTSSYTVKYADGFWPWFYGFLDAEGSFGADVRVGRGFRFYPNVRIGVRSDDLPALQYIREQLDSHNIGNSIHFSSTKTTHVAHLSVNKLSDAQALAKHLSGDTLRSKKAKDLQIWLDLVRETSVPITEQSQSHLCDLYGRMVSGRSYSGLS